MPQSVTPQQAVDLLRAVTADLLRREGPALSTHQLGVYLTCYLHEGDHTVRGLAADLNLSKSVITRALDKLVGLDLIRRVPDPTDRRSIIAARTEAGERMLSAIQSLALDAARTIVPPGAPGIAG